MYVLSMYIVHSPECYVNIKSYVFDPDEVAETKIDASAAKNAPGVQERPWGPPEGQGGV